MHFPLHYLSSALLISSCINALPLESHPKNKALVARARSYSIVNVDGGSTAPPPQTTIVEKETKTTTKTTTVTDSHPATTNIVTASANPTPAPVPSPTSTPCTSETTTVVTVTERLSQTTHISVPSVVTIIITETAEPTRFYDNGLWHTRYAVKTFEAVAVPTTTLSTSAKRLTASPSIIAPQNGTQYSP